MEMRRVPMPMNTEGKGSELREGVRLKAQYLLVLEEIFNSNTKNTQTAGIEGTQCQFRIPGFNIYIQTGYKGLC